MGSRLKSEKQRKLFEAIAKCGELIFATGKHGCSANIVGEFVLRSHNDEDQLDMGDGTNHVHVDWANVERVEAGLHGDEGMLTFKKGDDTVFKLYRFAGDWPDEVKALVGPLL